MPEGEAETTIRLGPIALDASTYRVSIEGAPLGHGHVADLAIRERRPVHFADL